MSFLEATRRGDSMTDLLILWHMHQPRYVHPGTGRPALPWVRLHAASGYLDMARVLEKRAGVRVTVNFVPILVEQIEQMLAGVRDPLEACAEKPADALDELERRLVLARSFSVRWNRAIDPRPRYGELLAKRGHDGGSEAVAAAARTFSTAELRDLQCLFLLSWLGFAAREDDPAIELLDRKGRDYSEDDKGSLLGFVRRAAGAVLPAWRRLAERGQVELSTSPYYHPILPLLCDTEAARRSRPGDALPTRFQHPDDARAQIELAQAAHERAFGTPARGMWPPEGSLSPEAVALYGSCGVGWLAADEETLVRSIDAAAAPGGSGAPRAHVWRHAGVDLVFRDRELSDRIGFRYANMPAEQAAEDLLGAARASGGDGGICGLFLDGENAWESYPNRGADFLYAFYGGLEREAAAGRMRARTIGETVAERSPGRELGRLHSGSWIDATFRIWIGDPEKNRAWNRLAGARAAVAEAEKLRGSVDVGVQAARQLLLAAEGSDWFWWFGEPFSSAEDPIFDELFRAHLDGAYRAIGRTPPDNLAEAIGQGGLVPRPAVPTALIHPMIDGKADQFYEWSGAVRYELGRGGAMAEAAPSPVERIFVGFDHDHLYLRLMPTRADRRRVTAAHLLLRMRAGEKDTTLRIDCGAAHGGPELATVKGRIGALDVVELAIPFAAAGAKARDEVRFWMTLEFAGIPFCRIPRDGVLSVTVPWKGWEDENWSA